VTIDPARKARIDAVVAAMCTQDAMCFPEEPVNPNAQQECVAEATPDYVEGLATVSDGCFDAVMVVEECWNALTCKELEALFEEENADPCNEAALDAACPELGEEGEGESSEEAEELPVER
jgi:hypothetical protein